MRQQTMAMVLCVSLLFGARILFAQGSSDPNAIFYRGNSYYEKREYAKAIEEYIKIADKNLESGNLYYNIGNGFFKLGKLGYAILCYEKAKRLMPGDADLNSNLDFARSLTEDDAYQSQARLFLVKLIEAPFRDMGLGAIAIVVAILYLLSVAAASIVIAYPTVGRKIKGALFASIAVFGFSLLSFGMRYYDEELSRYGIVVQKEIEAKYEPVDKSTTYYKIGEGCRVRIIKTRSGWRQIRRFDGKIAWVKKEAVEEI